MFLRLFLAIFVLCTSFPAVGEQACTEMWCQEGLTLQFDGGNWPKGEYVFKVNMDGAVTTCRGALPFKTCKGNVICDSDNIRIGESGCALPEEAHLFYGILSQKTPAHIAITIARGDGRKFSYEADVRSQCFYPNGPHCDARQCCSAVISVPLSWQ